MSCTECRERLVDYVEQLLDRSQSEQIQSHLTACSECRKELDAMQNLVNQLTETQTKVFSHGSLESLVMDQIIREQALELRRLKMRRRIRRIGIGSAVSAALAFFLVTAWWQSRSESNLRAAEVLAKAAEATPETTSIHIRGMVRTLPADNFDLVWAEGELVPIEIWKEFGGQTRWRIDKPGRAIAMDGESTVMLLKSGDAVKAPPCKCGFDTGFWHNLADVRGNLIKELQSGLAKPSDMKESMEKTDDGRTRQVVTVEVKSGLKKDDYMRNKFFSTASTRRTYRFDPQSGRLEGMESYLHTDKGDVLVFRLTDIEYNQPLDPSVFKLELPDDVNWIPLSNQIKKLPDNAKYEAMGPREAAEAFFNACANEDWDEVAKFYPGGATPRFKEYLGGLKVIHLGEAAKLSKSYPGWHVPYEIELRNGTVRKHKLAIRKDNPAKRFQVDGGL